MGRGHRRNGGKGQSQARVSATPAVGAPSAVAPNAESADLASAKISVAIKDRKAGSAVHAPQTQARLWRWIKAAIGSLLRAWARPRPPKPPKDERAAADPPKPSIDIKEVEALAGALNKSAERVQTLWFTFLTVTLYLALSTGTTTHRMLFLEEGLTLPLVNVKLPLVGFYFLAPAFYVVFHAYFLMMLVLLARTAKTFEDALGTAVPGNSKKDERERFRMRVENALFLQIIIGAERERDGANGRVLRAIALLSLAVVPVLLLLMFQMMFLPYHHDWLTWWHRVMVVIDLGLVWTLWPSYRCEWGERLMPRREFSVQMAVRSAASALVVVFSLAMATFPGERIHRNMVARSVDALARPVVVMALIVQPDVPAQAYFEGGRLSAFLFGYEMPVSILSLMPGRRGLLPNRLWLPEEQRLVDLEKVQNAEGSGHPFSLDLRHRDLVGAVLSRTDLRRANFQYAKIGKATFDRANLQNARFEWSNGVQASFDVANLEGAFFKEAKLQGASLGSAHLEGANLQYARLQGADLANARLQGASLYGAQLQGASLSEAQLQGALLDEARLQGAYFANAGLQGVSLVSARLQGALLAKAQLQGARIDHAQVQGASFAGAWVWRTNGYQTIQGAALFTDLQYDLKYDSSDITEPNFEGWREKVLAGVPQGQFRNAAQERLARLAGPMDADANAPTIGGFGADPSVPKATSEQYKRAFVSELNKLVCDFEVSRHVARRLIAGGMFFHFSSDFPEEFARFVLHLKNKPTDAKDEEAANCRGARRLTMRDLEDLDKLVKPVRK